MLVHYSDGPRYPTTTLNYYKLHALHGGRITSYAFGGLLSLWARLEVMMAVSFWGHVVLLLVWVALTRSAAALLASAPGPDARTFLHSRSLELPALSLFF